MAELIIGRNAATGQLCVQTNSGTKVFGEKDSVYQSVSREHVKLSFEDSDKIMLSNMNIENDTYVNGRGVEKKYVKIGDKIELGFDRYLLNWEWLKPYIPIAADIRPLKEMWEYYEECNERLTKRQFWLNMVRVALVSGLVACLRQGWGIWQVQQEVTDTFCIWCSIGVVLLLPLLYSLKFMSDFPKRRKKLEQEMEEKYRCPKCDYIFFPTKYSRIQHKKCPGCGAILKK